MINKKKCREIMLERHFRFFFFTTLVQLLMYSLFLISVQVLNINEYVVLDVRRTLSFLHKHFGPKKL